MNRRRRQRTVMTFEEVSPSQIPARMKAFQENLAIYRAARQLLVMGSGRALRIKLEDTDAEHVRKKAHVHFRHKDHRLRTKVVDGYFYMWIEAREPKRFEVTGVPANKIERG
jgi:hypothetical protein